MYSIGRLRVVLMSVSFSGGQILKALVSTEPLPARRPTATCCESMAHDFSLVGIARTAIFLHHQKSWLIDAGEASEVAFIGGINLPAQAVGSPGHIEGNRHEEPAAARAARQRRVQAQVDDLLTPINPADIAYRYFLRWSGVRSRSHQFVARDRKSGRSPRP